MKNIEEILKDAGLEVAAEQLTAITNGVKENYKTIADYEKQKTKLETSEDKVKTLTESVEKFKDVNPDELNNTISKLKEQLAQKDKDYQTKLSDRDFDDLLKDAIGTAKGRNAKAIKALLNIDALKASKNQKEDIDAAIKALTEADDSKMLFGSEEPNPLGRTNPIGKVGGGAAPSEFESKLRASMGLPAKN